MTHSPGHAVLILGQPPNPNHQAYRNNFKLFITDLAYYVSEMARELQQYSVINDRPTEQPYTPTNVTTVRSFDADATSVAELGDVLGTLIADLQSKGEVS